jgi:hypothetical protein
MAVSLSSRAPDTLTALAASINETVARAQHSQCHVLRNFRLAGQKLLEAKALLSGPGRSHGKWMGWVRENLKITHRQANKYMRLASGWDDLKLEPGSNLSINNALKILTAEDEDDCETLLPMPQRGDPAPASPGPRGGRDPDASDPLSPDDRHAEEFERQEAHDARYYESIGRQLANLSRTCSTITIFCPERGEKDVHLTICLRDDLKTRRYSRQGVLPALTAANDNEQCRRCPKCGADRRPDEFAEDSSRGDGRYPWCNPCNRDKVKMYKGEERAARSVGGSM